MTTVADPWPVVSDDPRIQSAYEAMREAGESHNIAELCALRQTPALQTDTTFLANRKDPFGGDENYAKRAVANCEAHGVTPGGRTYLGSLARFEGDPEAWVTSKADVRDICRRRGWGCEGAVEVKAPSREIADPFAAPYEVNPKLIQAEVERKTEGTDATPSEKAAMAEQIAQQRKGNTD
jgi:hypothetical protein